MQIQNKEMTQKEAASVFNIPRSTIKNKLKGVHKNAVGRPTTFSNQEEKLLASRLKLCSEFGIPMYYVDLRMIVKYFLDKTDRSIPYFKEGKYPGKKWLKMFAKRNGLSQRLVPCIKRSRAEVNSEQIYEYFDRLEKSLENIAPQKIWNYDETNLVDDPGKKKCIVPKGCKYPERIINSSTVGTSLMFCGNAKGEMMPVYVCYKSIQLHKQWTQYGPAKARYNRTESGWFTEDIFADWFFQTALPNIRRKAGGSVSALIGDNLAAHINNDVLKACKKNNIKFISLPPNTTDKTQPLDIAYFRPMKIAWRHILNKWKTTPERRKCSTLPKTAFPKLLKELVDCLFYGNGSANLIAGFEKAGIHPVNRMKVLERLPLQGATDISTCSQLDNSFIKVLTELRGSDRDRGSKAQRASKRTRLNVLPGQSICPDSSGSDSESALDDISSENDNSKEDTSSDESEAKVSIEAESSGDKQDNQPNSTDSVKPIVGSYYIVSYEGSLFPGKALVIG